MGKKEEYKYSIDEKEKFYKMYHASMMSIMGMMVEANNTLSQVSVSGSSNIHRMDSIFKTFMESFKAYDSINGFVNDLENNKFSDEIQKLISEFDKDGER